MIVDYSPPSLCMRYMVALDYINFASLYNFKDYLAANEYIRLYGKDRYNSVCRIYEFSEDEIELLKPENEPKRKSNCNSMSKELIKEKKRDFNLLNKFEIKYTHNLEKYKNGFNRVYFLNRDERYNGNADIVILVSGIYQIFRVEWYRKAHYNDKTVDLCICINPAIQKEQLGTRAMIYHQP